MLEISIIDNEEGLERLQVDWDRLLQQSSSDTVFLTWEWVTAWWRSYRTGKKLWILKVERDKDLVGLVPLYCKSFQGLGTLRYHGLYLIGDGSGDSDYLDAITKTGEEELIARSIVKFLLQHRGQWDVLFLNEVPEASLNLKLLRRFFQEEGCCWQEVKVSCTYVILPSDWNDYLKYLKPRVRTKIRSLTKRLEQDFRVRVHRCQQSDELQPWLESLFDLHNQRWQQNGQEGVFVSPAKRWFYRELSSRFLSRGWLRFYTLAVDGHYVAHQFCFEYRNTMFLLQEGFDPKWDKYSVGNVLRAYVFRDCIERKVAVYDFLGGVTPHKLSWGGVVKENIRGAAGLPIVKNRIFFELPRAFALGKKVLKTVLPETVLAWGRSLKEGRLFKAKVHPTGDL